MLHWLSSDKVRGLSTFREWAIHIDVLVAPLDTTRINKSLKATHSMGLAPVLHLAPNAFEEADFIAAQIKHLVAHTGNLLDYGDFAILLRYQALSRSIETSLQKAGIPSRVVGGHKFFDRTEFVFPLLPLSIFLANTITRRNVGFGTFWPTCSWLIPLRIQQRSFASLTRPNEVSAKKLFARY